MISVVCVGVAGIIIWGIVESKRQKNIRKETEKKVICLGEVLLSYIDDNKTSILKNFYDSHYDDLSQYIMLFLKREHNSDYFDQAYKKILPEIQKRFTDCLGEILLSYIDSNKKKLVKDFFSSPNDDFSEYVMSFLKKEYDSDYFNQAYENIFPKIQKRFTNKKFTISSIYNLEEIKHPEINIKNGDDAYVVMKGFDILNYIKNNCLIRPLYFSYLYPYETFTDKTILFSLYDKIMTDSRIYCENTYDKEEKLDILINGQNNSFINYLKTFIEVIENEDIENVDYFLSAYKNIYIDNSFTYDISSLPFVGDEKSQLIIQENNEKRKKAEQELIEECDTIIEECVQIRDKISNIVSNYKQGNNEDASYFSLIMEYFLVPYWGTSEYKFETFYDEKNGILCANVQIPSEDFAPRDYGIKTILKRTGEVRYKTFTENQFSKAYNDFTYQYVLSLIYFIFKLDYNRKITSICLNGIKSYIDKSDGNSKESCILSIHTTRDAFEKINLANVDAKACFKALKGVAGVDFMNASPVAPLLQFDKKDKRFVEGYDVATQLNEATNLASMDWQDFENLIRDIFEKEFAQDGGEVKVTQASRDGGVDAIAFDPDPIRGGKIVIQAKRYTNVVGVSAVRDLYGTVHNEGAIKGILVTTSNFGPDAYEFAKNKPLTLLSGTNLLYLLEKHGYKAKIDIKEAKKNLGFADKTKNN